MSKTRTRIESTIQIKTLDDANMALAEIGTVTLQLEVIDGKATKHIGAIKEKAARDGETGRNRIKELENALHLFAEYNKLELFRDAKTQQLAYGNFGFRKSTTVSVKKVTLDLLKKLFGGKGVRTKEEVDKEILKDFSDEELAQVDAAKVEKDTFFYEVNREEVNKNMLKAG